MLALARKSVSRALDEDARKAALNSPDENVKAAILALSRRRAPSALLFALKAADKAHPDARNVVGEALLDLGLPAAAMTCFETSSTTVSRPLVGNCALRLHRPDGEVSAACSEAHGLCRPSDKLELAHLQALSGRYDEAYASALTLSQSFNPGDEGLNASTLLACEMEFAMYAEAVWPQSASTERLQEAERPEGIDLPAWRLQRGIEGARAYCRRVPQFVGAAVLAAEMLLEAQLYSETWVRPSGSTSRSAGMAAPTSALAAGEDDEACSERDEILALMRMAGVAESKLTSKDGAARDRGAARRLIEWADASSEAEQPPSSEWQMRRDWSGRSSGRRHMVRGLRWRLRPQRWRRGGGAPRCARR